ncbi:MAG: adenosylcobinamide-GDP ribazoletransferase [Alphaproteobacteria bacterium]|nr:adenosylcobinamide-GDP ribazoletransferase [Alphaproteobacteria bacterium]
MRDLKIAMIFFTRVPVAYDGALGLNELKRAWRAVPLVGAVIGAVGAGVYAAAHHLGLAPMIAAILAVMATALLTGALHEDGLADFVDGCGGGRERERRLAIMRDSRIGTYGVLALGFTAALRIAALAAIATPYAVALTLIAVHAVARAAIPVSMTRMDPARSDGLAADAGKPARATLAIALCLAAVLALGLLGAAAGAGALLVACMAALIVAAVARRLVGGYTGDVLGAVEQAAETAILVSLAAMSGAR